MRKNSKSEDKKPSPNIKFVQDENNVKAELYKGPIRKHSQRALNFINKVSKSLQKQASCSGSSSSMSFGRGGDTMMSSPQFYHPEYEPSSLVLPRDPIEVNAWCRYFYKYDPLVSTACDCHAELPISTIRLTLPECQDRKKALFIKNKYEEMCSTENLDLFNKLIQIGIEHYKIGNVFPFTQWNNEKMMWTRMSLLDPDFVEIDKLQFSNKIRIDLRPNDRLKEVVSNGPDHPKTGEIFKTLPIDVVEMISSNKKIPLNTDPINGSHVAHIANKMADYDMLGTGIIERNFKALVYKDRLRQSQDAIAARHLTPKHLIWAENMSNADVGSIREQVDNAFADPDYAIITNFQLNWELIGTSQGLMQLSPEWDWITNELMIGLMINKSFLLGEGAFANGQTVLEVMNQRYANYREKLESFIITSLFIPMAKRNNWYEWEDGIDGKRVQRLIYPRIKWNKINLVDDTAHKQLLSQMAAAGQIDLQTYIEQFGLDTETIKDRLERLQGTVLDINNNELNRAIAAEVGRALAPALAIQKAEELGLQLPEENPEALEDEFEEDDGIEKTAETREERRFQRSLQKNRKRLKRTLDSLDVGTRKKLKPPRVDLKLIKNQSTEYDNLAPLIDKEKIEEILKEEEKSDEEWIMKMQSLGLDENSRRCAFVLEKEFPILKTNELRMKAFSQYVPQIFASKIKTKETLTDKVAKVSERYSEKISNLITDLNKNLDGKSEKEAKEIFRNAIEREFSGNQ